MPLHGNYAGREREDRINKTMPLCVTYTYTHIYAGAFTESVGGEYVGIRSYTACDLFPKGVRRVIRDVLGAAQFFFMIDDALHGSIHAARERILTAV